MADGFVPPQEVRSNAKRGLELREKYGRGGTAVGVARARDLLNGASLPLDTIKRMNSYFARHEVDKKGEGWGKDSAGYIAWLLWGGDAGWAWAKKIIRENESKEKAMALDLTTSYFSIEKADRNADGTLTVYGKATDDSLDIDQQICDAGWLDRAMPEWFKSGGNIREQHSQIAAGVAKEYEAKADGHYISALVVDPNSVKKVETGVLKGFSIGIKSPRVVRDQKAVNGRIIDGQIVEVSLVDRPANPNAKLMLAKSVEGEPALVQVEEFIDADVVKHPGHGDQSVHGKPKGGAGGGTGSSGGAAGGGAGVPKAAPANMSGHPGLDKEIDKLPAEVKDSSYRTGYMAGQASNSSSKEGADLFNRANSWVKDSKTHVSEGKELSTSQAKETVRAIGIINGMLSSGGKSTDAEMRKALELALAEIGIVKHPGHGDQSVHGKPRGGSKPGAGGGAGSGEGSAGGGAGSSSSGVKESHAKQIEGHEADARGLSDDVSSIARGDSMVRPAAQSMRAAAGRLQDATGAKTKEEAVSSLKKAKMHVDNAVKNLEDQNYNSEASDAYSLSKRITSTIGAIGSSKASDAELRKALQSALHLITTNKSEDAAMGKTIVELPVEVVGDLFKFDKAEYEAARDALANLISIEAQEAKEGHNEIQSIAHLLEAVSHLHAWYEGEEAEGEVMEEDEEIISEPIADKAPKKDADAEAEADAEADAEAEADDEKDAEADAKKCPDCGMKMDSCKCDMGMKKKKEADADAEADDDAEKKKEADADAEADADTCPTCKKEMKLCKCKSDAATDMTPTAQTGATLDGTTIVPPAESPKSVSVDPSTDLEAIVEEVVEKATTSLKAKIAELVSAKEAALEKSMSLEAELATAKSLAVAGGPKRTAGPISIEKSDLLTKAAIYKAKAQATTDPTLAKGFKALADEFLSKASEATSN